MPTTLDRLLTLLHSDCD